MKKDIRKRKRSPRKPKPKLLWPGGPNAKYSLVLAADQSPAADFLLAMLRRKAIEFVYWSGSTPGAYRRVLPYCLFSVGEDGPIYARAWCLTRCAERVFCMDWVTLPGEAEDYTI